MPDEILHPGHYVKEWLAANQKTQADLANAMRFKAPFISKIVNGRAHITPKVAVRLEAATQVPAANWMKYQTDYALALLRSGEE